MDSSSDTLQDNSHCYRSNRIWKSTVRSLSTVYYLLTTPAVLWRCYCKTGQTIGHNLQSYTSDIRSVWVSHPSDGHPVVFVDTPGCDDTYKPDQVIVSMVVDWLVQTWVVHFYQRPVIPDRKTVIKGMLTLQSSYICIGHLIMGWPGWWWRTFELSQVSVASKRYHMLSLSPPCGVRLKRKQPACGRRKSRRQSFGTSCCPMGAGLSGMITHASLPAALLEASWIVITHQLCFQVRRLAMSYHSARPQSPNNWWQAISWR